MYCYQHYHLLKYVVGHSCKVFQTHETVQLDSDMDPMFKCNESAEFGSHSDSMLCHCHVH